MAILSDLPYAENGSSASIKSFAREGLSISFSSGEYFWGIIPRTAHPTHVTVRHWGARRKRFAS